MSAHNLGGRIHTLRARQDIVAKYMSTSDGIFQGLASAVCVEACIVHRQCSLVLQTGNSAKACMHAEDTLDHRVFLLTHGAKLTCAVVVAHMVVLLNAKSRTTG